MKEDRHWGYEETSLKQRIDVHEKYAKYEINDWILERVALKHGERVLDIGCGNGKQVIAYAQKAMLALVVGMDVSTELLRQARMKAKEGKVKITFIKHDANLPFQFNDNSFDLVSCCFAIYYLLDVEKFLLEIKRVLSKGGRIFVAAPTIDNAKEMILLHSRVTGREVSQFRERRVQDEIIPSIKRVFSPVKIDIFNNPVTFPDSQSFLDYYASTLLLQESSSNPEERAVYLRKVKEHLDKIIEQSGAFVLNKQVYGILGYQ